MKPRSIAKRVLSGRLEAGVLANMTRLVKMMLGSERGVTRLCQNLV